MGTESRAQRAGAALWRRRYALLGSLVVLALTVWLLRAGALPVLPPLSAFRRVAWWTVAAHVVLYGASLWVRAARWKWLLSPIANIDTKRTVQISFVGYGALLLLPFRIGEFVRPLLLRRHHGVSAVAATGSALGERLIEGAVLSLLLLLGLVAAPHLEPLPERIGDLAVPTRYVRGAAYLAQAVFLGALAVAAAFYWQRRRAELLVRKTVGVVSTTLASLVAKTVRDTADGLSFLPNAKGTLMVCLATAAYYVLNAWALELLVDGVGLSLSFSQACVVVGVLHIGVLLPNAPGYFGAYQLALYAGLAMYVPTEAIRDGGAAAVFLLYSLQVGMNLVFAAIAWATLSRAPRDVVHA